jgi:hypothetical protein
MKRISITGADRDPAGAFFLTEDAIAAVGGVVEGENVVIYLCDEPLECDAIIVRSPGWEPHIFAREDSAWRPSEET